jgi:transcriptional regulator with XRE-family HTH domain
MIKMGIVGLMEKRLLQLTLLSGQRIRSFRTMRGWTQQELGNRADINYKFLGEIERGMQNPSFNVLTKIASGLDLELPESFRFEHEALDRKEIETQIKTMIKALPDDALRQIFLLLRVFYPVR